METIKAKVVGPNPILGVHTGNYVDIDPELYSIPALVEAGHIELSKTAEKTLAEGS